MDYLGFTKLEYKILKKLSKNEQGLTQSEIENLIKKSSTYIALSIARLSLYNCFYTEKTAGSNMDSYFISIKGRNILKFHTSKIVSSTVKWIEFCVVITTLLLTILTLILK